MDKKDMRLEPIEIDEEIEVNGGNNIVGYENLIDLARTIFNTLFDSKEKP